ncbi:hypothetical protein AB1Y20_010658 [Prymnesium parvum]|uniref:Nucleotide-diphospho-sugar transferase domain-containing protein n=1 Tax=Prymnesium parvum TaxID=97485 RepID=A0AB34IS03_PRYPA
MFALARGLKPLLLALAALLCDAQQAAARPPSRRHAGRAASHRAELPAAPTHSTLCGVPPRTCRPGEGNLKGYEMWSQPYAHVDEKDFRATPPHVAEARSPHYAALVRLARGVERRGVVVVAAADFDYRELAENWYASARRLGMPALVLALDAEACEHFRARGLPAANLTTNLLEWHTTRLQRHIQRALMERLLAATALADAGMNVLLTDATAVFVADPLPFFHAAPAGVDLFVQRDSYPASAVRTLGTALSPAICYLRAGGAGLAGFMRRVFVRGMIEFYLRWTNAVGLLGLNGTRHPPPPCLSTSLTLPIGYAVPRSMYSFAHEKALVSRALIIESGPRLVGITKKANTERSNATTVIELSRHFKGCAADVKVCVRIGLLPYDKFPRHGVWRKLRSTALVYTGPSTKASRKRKFRGHRLRLDRYDEVDFDNMVASLKSEGLWMLNSTDDALL